jgi:isoleucyl-tRNA synthetase
MSISLKNNSDPTDVINSYGVDVVGLYLMNSSAAHIEPTRFDEESIQLVGK